MEEEVSQAWQEVRNGGRSRRANDFEDKGEVMNEEGEEEGAEEEEEGHAGVAEGEELFFIVAVTAAAAAAAAAAAVGPEGQDAGAGGVCLEGVGECDQ